MFIICLAVVVLSVLLMIWSDRRQKNAPLRETRIDGVVRIFMHERGSYSVMIADPDTKVATLRSISCDTDGYGVPRVRFIADVADGEMMWAALRVRGKYEWVSELDFHVRSANDVGGGGWNHGKFGSGTTSVVQ